MTVEPTDDNNTKNKNRHTVVVWLSSRCGDDGLGEEGRRTETEMGLGMFDEWML